MTTKERILKNWHDGNKRFSPIKKIALSESELKELADELNMHRHLAEKLFSWQDLIGASLYGVKICFDTMHESDEDDDE